MDESDKNPPVVPLEYGRPMMRAPGHTRDLVIGIIISIALALGVGFLTFGLMIASPNMNRNMEMSATFTAVGTSLLSLVAGLVATVLWLRFVRR